MSVILQLKGALSEKKQKRMDLAVRIDAKVKAIKDALATSAVKPAAELDLQSVATHAAEALELQEELKVILEEMKTIEKELGNG